MNTLIFVLVGIVVILAVLGGIGVLFSKLYVRASKELAFVRTGNGGEKVILDKGLLVVPFLHECLRVNMKTLKLEVSRVNEWALITKDRMRVDVLAEFYVNVEPTKEAVARAAQTLGRRTMQVNELRELVEGKFVDTLRSVAAKMTMNELHEKREDFIQSVQQNVKEDLAKNGLALESVSLTSLDQTDKKYFRTDNAFDAEGLTKLTEVIEEKKRIRNDIVQENAVVMSQKNLETKQEKLKIDLEDEQATLNQRQEVETLQAQQEAEVAKQQELRRLESEEARIKTDRDIKEKEIQSQRDLAVANVEKQKALETANILREKDVTVASVAKQKEVEAAELEKQITISEQVKLKADADAKANDAKALAIAAQEKITTAQELEEAERDKAVALLEARQNAEKKAIEVRVSAEAEKAAAEDRAEAVRLEAQAKADAGLAQAKGEADAVRVKAVSDAEAVRLKADADERRYQVEAKGKSDLHAADNSISDRRLEFETKKATLDRLPKVVEATTKPMDNIDSIKIVQVDGLNPVVAGAGAVTVGDGEFKPGGKDLPSELVTAALRYQTHKPMLTKLMSDIGLDEESVVGDAVRNLVNSNK